MAQSIYDLFPSQANPPSLEFPFGSARNVSVQGATDGTPYDEALINDYQGFFQKLLSAAGFTPNGQVETALASQYFDAMRAVQGVPGFVDYFAGVTPPPGYLVCDGSAISRTTYADLFAAIGVIYGSGDGSTTFNLPDARGLFTRFLDQGAGVDPDVADRFNADGFIVGDLVGSQQTADVGQHFHRQGNTFTQGDADNVGVYGDEDIGANTPQSTDTQGANGNVVHYTDLNDGTETRPVNIAFIGVIKY